jgi:hypothetical protein
VAVNPAEFGLPVPPEAITPVNNSQDSFALPPIDLKLPIQSPVTEDQVSEALPKRPIWEERGQVYAESPGLKRYVIRPYQPGAEGIQRFPRFDHFDHVPDHYYPSRKEYEEARSEYQKGKYPEKLVDVHSYSWGKAETAEVIILEQHDSSRTPEAEPRREAA